MIKRIDYSSPSRKDKDGYTLYYINNNPLFEYLQDYHFERDDMCEVFDVDFMDWFWDHIETRSDEFLLTRNDDEFYIIHFRSGTIISWYKHMGRANTCNKNLTLDDLREFKKLLLEDFGYEEV